MDNEQTTYSCSVEIEGNFLLGDPGPKSFTIATPEQAAKMTKQAPQTLTEWVAAIVKAHKETEHNGSKDSESTT